MTYCELTQLNLMHKLQRRRKTKTYGEQNPSYRIIPNDWEHKRSMTNINIKSILHIFSYGKNKLLQLI